MSVKIYVKRGKPNYKEQKLLKELQPIIDAQIDANPDLKYSFKPASNIEELKELHRQYVSQDVEYEDVETQTSQNNNMSKEEPIDEKEPFEDMDGSSDFIDPFNRQEPTTYDYTNDGGLSSAQSPKGPARTSFDEPLSFEEAFELPEDEDNEAQPDSVNGNSKNAKQKPEQKSRQEKPEPINSSFDEMSNGKKKRSTKKFAKYIVETVCMLAEKGFIWYATKDINEVKLTEYELNGEMDLSLIVSLETGQEVTVKQFFQHQSIQAEQLSKFDEQEKADLAEALGEVLLEKGIAPTPMQELLLITAKIIGEKAVILMQVKSQQNSLLSQLREMAAVQPPQPKTYNEPSQPAEEAYKEVEQKLGNVPEYNEEIPIEQVLAEMESNSLEIEEIVETKE